MSIMQSDFKGYTGLNIGLIFGGFCLITAGYLLSQPLAIAIGGTFFGASLGSLFGRIANKDILENFALFSQPRMTSEEKDIQRFRQKWHLYYVNRYKDKYFWRHSDCDLSKVSIPGYLNTNEKNKMLDGSEYTFNVEAGVRGNKLIMIHSIEGKEKTIRIFPTTFNESIDASYCGFVCVTTWDNTRLIGPTILVKDPSKITEDLLKIGENPTINDPKIMKEMDDFWYKGIKRLNCDLLATPSGLIQVQVNDNEENSSK